MSHLLCSQMQEDPVRDDWVWPSPTTATVFGMMGHLEDLKSERNVSSLEGSVP